LNINIDFILGVTAGIIIFILHLRHSGKTIDALLNKVGELTDKVMAKDFNEITKNTAIKLQAEISKAVIDKQPADPKKEFDEKTGEGEQVL